MQYCGTHLWTELSESHASIIQGLLDIKGPELESDHLCKAWRRQYESWPVADPAGTRERPAGIGSGHGNWYGSSPIQSSSRAQGIHQSRIDLSKQPRVSQSQQSTRLQQDLQTSIDMPEPSTSKELLGVKGPRRTHALAQIEVSQHMDDGAFFSQLKKDYRKCRGFLRYWASMWQLDHCDFCKV